MQFLFVLAYWASKEVFGCPSRRLCNLPYCLYQCSLINSFILYLLVIDRLMIKRNENLIESVVNYSQLSYFIYSNLLTGLTNLLFWTYYEGVAFDIGIFLIYFMIKVIILNNCRKHNFKAKM